MTITEALKLVRNIPADASSFDVLLACGFTPLHLQTLLRGHLQQHVTNRRVNLTSGLYGDLPGTIQSAAEKALQSAVVVIEWSDLDPRLGFREGGRWGAAVVDDVIRTAEFALRRISAALDSVPAGTRTVLSLPTLPFPVLFHTTGFQAGTAELRMRELVSNFATAVSVRQGIAVLNPQWLAEKSPEAARYDFKSDLLTGLPYTLSHADALATGIAALVVPAAPRKGIITDLDDTFWYGIVGEVGPENVAWDLASHHYLHGLYQKLLAALADEGVLVSIASKNDPAVVAQALQRRDLNISADKIFPAEVHWNAKSASIGKILKAWNIAADSVVFVDDSPMELAEVAAQHPGIECLLFPRDDYAAGYKMLRRLRDLFGRERVSADDAIRLESIRRGADFQHAVTAGAASEEFLQGAEAVVAVDFEGPFDDPRVLELVNKTNQFNLNGVRYTEADWRAMNAEPASFIMSVAYEDKFGPLGKTAVVQGKRNGNGLRVQAWVMSCRAFARRIEHQCVRLLFERFDVQYLLLDFTRTPRNGPTRDFLQAVSGSAPDGTVELNRSTFDDVCPPLYHKVFETERSKHA